MDDLDEIKAQNQAMSRPQDLLQVPSLVPNFVPDESENYMNSLPPPPPFDLEIEDLTIGVPSSSSTKLPSFTKKLFKKGDAAPQEHKTIVRNVSTSCASGEVLAMWVHSLLQGLLRS